MGDGLGMGSAGTGKPPPLPSPSFQLSASFLSCLVLPTCTVLSYLVTSCLICLSCLGLSCFVFFLLCPVVWLAGDGVRIDVMLWRWCGAYWSGGMYRVEHLELLEMCAALCCAVLCFVVVPCCYRAVVLFFTYLPTYSTNRAVAGSRLANLLDTVVLTSGCWGLGRWLGGL